MNHSRTARDIMVTHLVTCEPETDVFMATSSLLRHHITGAPVIDAERNYYGVFSEKCSMKVLSQGVLHSRGEKMTLNNQ